MMLLNLFIALLQILLLQILYCCIDMLVFCEQIKSYEEAEKYYLLSLEKDPNYIFSVISYADFLFEVRSDISTAER